MASATVGVLRVLLTANGSEFEAAMKKAQGAAQAWSKDLESIGRQATALGSSLTRTLTLPLVAALGGAAKAAMDFESDFANVAKTVDGVSDSAGKLTPKGQALAMTFRQMAKEIPATTSELTAIAALGGQMGVPIEQLAHFTRNVAALGVAVDGISTEAAAAGLAQIGNITGSGTKNVQQMASALVHLGNSSNATEADILEFTKRLAGAGNAVGMTVPEIMALGTAMADVGINAEAGGTAMSTVITKMSVAVSEGGAKLQEFARVADMSAEQFAATWKRSPVEAMDAFIQGLSRLKGEGADLNLTMGEIGTEGIRVADTLKRLAGAGDGVAKSLKIANEGFDSGNKHLEEAQKKYATTANQLKVLWNNIKDVGITIGGALLPAIQAATAMVGSMLPVIDTLAKAFAALPGGVQLVALGMVGMVAAAGPLIFAFGQLAIASSTVTRAFTAKGLATRILTTDLGALLLSTRAQIASQGLMAASAATLTGAVRGLWVVIAAHPFVAVTAGIAAATAALVHFYAKGKENQLNAETQAAKQDSINKAIRDGAAATISYTDAIVYNDRMQAIRAATFDKSTAAQKARIEAEMALGRITQEQGRAELVALAAVEAGNAVREKRITIAQSVAAQEAQVQNEIKATGYTMAQLLTELKANEQGFKGWAKQVGLSSETVSFLEGKLKGNAAAHRELVKEQTAAEKATEALNKRLEKQADALEKLGIVTENEVVKQLGQFNELIRAAVEAGVPLDKVLAALAPRLEELRQKAVASGVSMETFGDALDQATASARKMLDEIIRRVPQAVEGLSEIPGEVVDLTRVLDVAGIQAQNTADSFRFFGLRTREELEQTAQDAVVHFDTIKRSGQATPQQIQEAFDKMNAALHAAGMEMRNDWALTFDLIADAAARSFDGIVGAVANAVVKIRAAIRIMRTEMSTSQRVTGAGLGAVDVWNSTGQEGQSTGESTISGIASGAAAGSYFGPWGTVIGGIIGGVVGYFKGRDANNEAKKANDARDEYLSQFGRVGQAPDLVSPTPPHNCTRWGRSVMRCSRASSTLARSRNSSRLLLMLRKRWSSSAARCPDWRPKAAWRVSP
jgi:TP901 family phage tail tape measure protein